MEEQIKELLKAEKCSEVLEIFSSQRYQPVGHLCNAIESEIFVVASRGDLARAKKIFCYFASTTICEMFCDPLYNLMFRIAANTDDLVLAKILISKYGQCRKDASLIELFLRHKDVDSLVCIVEYCEKYSYVIHKKR